MLLSVQTVVFECIKLYTITIYGVSVEGSENANTTCYTPSKTPLGDILSPSAKQPM